MTTIVFQDDFEVPMDIRSLADFRAWTLSDSFPSCGRIDYVAGQIEVDMSPEEYYAHGVVKVEIVRVLAEIVKETQNGDVLTDSTRIASTAGNFSAEPDIVFISYDSLDSGRVRLIPKSGEVDRHVEVEGAPDMIAEIISDSSVTKDKRRLAAAYFAAGVDEYWLVDARHSELVFEIRQRGTDQFDPLALDADGFQYSPVFQRRFKLECSYRSPGRRQFDLHYRQ